MTEKKKFFPKIKKQLSDFLTDESGEITKKDALGLGAAATLVASLSHLDMAEARYGDGARDWGAMNNSDWGSWLNKNTTSSSPTCDPATITALQQQNAQLQAQISQYQQSSIDQNITSGGGSWNAWTWFKVVEFKNGSITCSVNVPSHVSWVVNGHMSSDPSSKVSLSHGSHSSHSSGGWC